MQKRPLLLSPANSGVPHRQKPRLSVGKVFVAALCGFFVLYGALDIAGRVLFVESSNAATEDLYDYTEQSAGGVPAPLIPLTPTKVRIPALAITASVEEVGQNGAGNMAAPKRFDTVAWYKLGSRPGEAGNAIIAGHLNNSLGLSGVFEKLGTLPLGSEIIVEGASGEIRYVVREMHVYDANDAPVAAIFSKAGPSRLILITCDGAWDAGVRSYDKRLIVVAEPI